jgi:hypothetical protein
MVNTKKGKNTNVAFCCSYEFYDFAWAAQVITSTMLLQGPNESISISLYKTMSKTAKWNDGESMDFSIKCWKLSVQTILFIQGGDGGMGMLCYINATLEGIYVQQHELDIPGFSIS